MISDNEFNISGGYFKFSVKRKLGSGAFGEVYHGTKLKTNEEIAIKIEPSSAKYPQLKNETKILKYLQGGKGIPNCHHYESSKTYNFMAMDLLGLSIEDLFNKCYRKFNLKTVLMIADQMLSRIEFVHSRFYIHRDIKPDNFLIGNAENKNLIYIVDFGLAKNFRDSLTGLHIPYKDGKTLTGTARYASIYTHMGIEQSRRDDLEALFNVIMYLCRGDLPWQGIRAKTKKEKYDKIMEKKIYYLPNKICENHPEEFLIYIKYCQGLQFDQKPDYNFIKDLFTNVMKKYNYESDFLYDWILLKKIEDEQEDNSSNNTTKATSNYK